MAHFLLNVETLDVRPNKKKFRDSSYTLYRNVSVLSARFNKKELIEIYNDFIKKHNLDFKEISPETKKNQEEIAKSLWKACQTVLKRDYGIGFRTTSLKIRKLRLVNPEKNRIEDYAEKKFTPQAKILLEFFLDVVNSSGGEVLLNDLLASLENPDVVKRLNTVQPVTRLWRFHFAQDFRPEAENIIERVVEEIKVKK